MKDFKRVKRAVLLLFVIFVAFVNSQDVVEQNGTKTVDLQDPKIDSTVKSALENGSVSEVVVRKDLLLFPVNAPNLVISHSQEIHAVPQNNGTNENDGKPTAAQVAEVNEYSLSQLIPTNDTDNDTSIKAMPTSPPLLQAPENDSVLEPGKLLEIVSGINLSDGLVTEKVPVPSEAQSLSLPKQSIVGLLSKSLAAPDDPSVSSTPTPAAYDLVKRSVDPKDDAANGTENSKRSDDSKKDDSDSKSEEDDSTDSSEIEKRSADSQEDDDDSDDSSSSEENKSATVDDSSSNSTEEMKRSADSDEDDDDSTSNSTEYYDHDED